ncbi:sugar phosphorylase [Thalassospira tepidiphila]|jgi:sucrose phosphorylase|uniref:alpha-amylase family glycosyl hydrolase n=1 Tax=Thalassospira tepidiphila TaxID=393657 RepID=UPI001BCCF0F9|nr:alpha-amylase family glycosyl hydrolase [Thalassospira tepidiphila]MBS8273091.1 sugar phosphorylase [Thalassospira tepidiphila]
MDRVVGTSGRIAFASAMRNLLADVYPGHDHAELVRRVFEVLGLPIEGEGPEPCEEYLRKWDQRDAFLITYGDSIQQDGKKGLQSLGEFHRKWLKDWLTGIHILPFHPFTSDDGFSVSDFDMLRPELGDWSDVEDLAKHGTVMADLVANHISASHPWYQQFLAGEKPGVDYIKTASLADDLSDVVRPRSHELLNHVVTKDGEKQVWCTFSYDQVDLDYGNPDVFFEMLKVVLNYLKHGVRVVRLDAIGFIWKEVGTTSINLEQTHKLIKAMRLACNAVHPDVLFITETNLPLLENLSYFGNQDEAHLIYNFSLPPVIIHALLSGRSDYIRKCIMAMPPAPAGCTFFNFTASHDGIGLRPAENLIPDDDIDGLRDHAVKMGGQVSYRALKGGGQKPYELNVTLFSMLAENFAGEATMGLERFVMSQAIAMSLEGIPAIYIQTILATENDQKAYEETGIPRRLNRKIWKLDDAEETLSREGVARSAFDQLRELISIRQGQPAFHPNATQYTLNLGPDLLGVWRQSHLNEQSIFCVFNLTEHPQDLDLSKINLIMTEGWQDLITQQVIGDYNGMMKLAPYQIVWISNLDGRNRTESRLLQRYRDAMPV